MMLELLRDNLPIVVAVAVVLALLLAWWALRRGGAPAVRAPRADVLDPGAAPARRNQALIDSPIAASIVPPVSVTPHQAGGEAIAATPLPPENAEALAWEAAERAREAAPANAPGDDLRRLKGVGPKLAGALAGLGVTRFDQIAGWTEADIDRIDPQLGSFGGRIRRDSWVEQARLLAGGDLAGFEARFGKV